MIRQLHYAAIAAGTARADEKEKPRTVSVLIHQREAQNTAGVFEQLYNLHEKPHLLSNPNPTVHAPKTSIASSTTLRVDQNP